MKKWLASILVLAVVVTAGGALYAYRARAAAATTAEAEHETAVVKRGPLRKVVQCTGRVVSNLDVEIKCKSSGLVTKIPCDVSDPVHKGDLLVELDPIDQQRAVQQAEANLAASTAKHDQAKANLAVAEASLVAQRLQAKAALASSEARVKDSDAKAKRERDLLERKQSSIEEAETAHTTAVEAEQALASAKAQMETVHAAELELETRRQDINLAKADVDSDTIALAIANQKLTETKVIAPIDGVVSTRTVQIGQIIASGINNVGGGTAMMTLADLSHMFVLASVDESDIGGVALNQQVQITADAYPGKPFSGNVVRIAAKGVNVSNVVTFEVRIEVASENKALLKPEMTANVEIIVAEKEDVLLAPARAVVRKKGETVVTLQQPDGSLKEDVPVGVGLSSGTDVEILSGLQEHDTVVFKKNDSDSRWRNQTPNMRPSMMMMSPGMRGGGRH